MGNRIVLEISQTAPLSHLFAQGREIGASKSAMISNMTCFEAAMRQELS